MRRTRTRTGFGGVFPSLPTSLWDGVDARVERVPSAESSETGPRLAKRRQILAERAGFETEPAEHDGALSAAIVASGVADTPNDGDDKCATVGTEGRMETIASEPVPEVVDALTIREPPGLPLVLRALPVTDDGIAWEKAEALAVALQVLLQAGLTAQAKPMADELVKLTREHAGRLDTPA